MMYMRLDISGSVVISCIMILGGLCITRINSRITTDTNMTAVSRYAPFKLRFSPGRSVEMMSMMTFSTAVFLHIDFCGKI